MKTSLPKCGKEWMNKLGYNHIMGNYLVIKGNEPSSCEKNVEKINNAK